MRPNPFLKIAQIIYSIIAWLFLITSCFPLFLIDFLVWLFTFWWDKRTWVLHRFSIFWALIYVWLNPFWRIDIKGIDGEEVVEGDTSLDDGIVDDGTEA